MTRKDYVALAEALHDVKPNDDEMGVYQPEGPQAWESCVNAIARVLAKDNNRFNRARFIRACQGEK